MKPDILANAAASIDRGKSARSGCECPGARYPALAHFEPSPILKLDPSFHLKRFLAFTLGDLRSATWVLDHETQAALARGETDAAAARIARRKSAYGIRNAGIGAVAFLVFMAIDARLTAPRWPAASLAWFALGLAGAIVFAWHFYVIRGPAGWRTAWYRFSGNPLIDDLPSDRVLAPVAPRLRFWKSVAGATGAFGAVLLLSAMAAVRFAPLAWTSPWYWAAIGVAGLAVYWPTIYLASISNACLWF